MGFSIEEFKGQLRGGGARPTHFDVNLTSALNLIGPSAEKFTFTCKAASIPASTIGKVTPKYFGRDVHMAGDRTFEDWTVTIINDTDFLVRDRMEAWMGKMNGHETNIAKLGSTNPNLYKSDAIVNHYDKTGSLVRSYQVSGIFPTNISEIQLGWDNTDQIEEFTVTFSIDYWLPAGISVGSLAEVI